MKKQELADKIRRKAVTFQVGGFRPDDRPLSSWLGKVLVAKAGETWPLHHSRPMMPVCQINLEELPFKPENLQQFAFLTLFADVESLSENPGEKGAWSIRTYCNLSELSSLVMPEIKFQIKPFQLKPQLVEDFPHREDCPIEIPEKFDDDFEDIFPNAAGIKIGGWPTLIQGEISWSPLDHPSGEAEFVFQIDSVAKAGIQWGDNGIVYFGKCGDDSNSCWCFDWQTC